MANKKGVEIAVGLFVAGGLVALVMLAMKVSNLSTISREAGYSLTASFANVGGLRVRSPVSLAGVRVGEVGGIKVDDQTYEAVVTLNIASRKLKLPEDTSASVLTSGLLGEQYIGLEPGGAEQYLKNGDRIRLTQSALVLEQVLGQFLFGKAAGEK